MARSTSVCQIIQRGLVQTSEISFILHFDNEKTKSCLSSNQYNPGEINDKEIYLHGCYAISQLTYIRLHCALQSIFNVEASIRLISMIDDTVSLWRFV